MSGRCAAALTLIASEILGWDGQALQHILQEFLFLFLCDRFARLFGSRSGGGFPD